MDMETMVVLSDGLFFEEATAVWKDVLPVVRWPDDMEEGAKRLGELSSEKEGYLLYGGDDLVGRVITAYLRRSDLGAHPLRIWPLQVGESLVAEDFAGAVEPQRAVRLIKGGTRRWKRESVKTLKVTASTDRGAWYGFSFGAGWIYRAFEARKRGRGSAGNFVTAWSRLATDTWRQDDGEPVAQRVAIDHRARVGAEGSLVATTLRKSYFGLGGEGDRALLWNQLSTPKLIRQAMTPDVLERSASEGAPFESVHLDTPQGWILDGRLHGTADPGVVQVVPGPSVSLIYPETGLRSMVKGVLRGRLS